MINPIGFTDVRDWADAVILDLDSPYAFGRLDDPDRWQDWAVRFCSASKYSTKSPPSPYGFDDWRSWAERAYTMLETPVGGGA